MRLLPLFFLFYIAARRSGLASIASYNATPLNGPGLKTHKSCRKKQTLLEELKEENERRGGSVFNDIEVFYAALLRLFRIVPLMLALLLSSFRLLLHLLLSPLVVISSSSSSSSESSFHSQQKTRRRRSRIKKSLTAAAAAAALLVSRESLKWRRRFYVLGAVRDRTGQGGG